MALTKVSRGLLSTGIVDNSTTTAITIDSSENVGIGGSPSTKLEVLDANGIGLRFGDVAAAPSSQTAGFIGMSTSAFSGNNGDLVLYPRTSAASNILLMGGNVGIGTVPTTDHNPVVEALQIGSTANLFGRNDAEITTLTSNSYLSVAGYPKYITTNEASEYIQTSGNHIWYNAPSGTAGAACTLTERLRIGAQGMITATSSVNDNYGLLIKNTNSTRPYGLGIALTNGTSNSTQALIVDESSNATKFIVYTNGNVGSATSSYGGISDLKLKENIVDAGSQWDDLKALRVRKYSFKEENSSEPTQIGVIAQEVEAAGMAGLVYETPDQIEADDGSIEDTEEVTKSMKYSVLYMKAIKALQEAMERIETLEAKVQTLENN